MVVTKLAFTICSNNYLAQAKTLGDSILEYNPGYKFVIGLVDMFSNDIDYNFFKPHEVVLIEDIGVQNFQSIANKYDIIELNTAVKASFFKYIFNRFKDLDYTYYLDPDLMLFDSLNKLDSEFLDSEILLTPHINTPIPIDDSFPHENLFLNYGIYNLGFIGVKRSENTLRFLDWWEERTLNFGFNRVEQGYFVDQLWINYVPLFFDKVKILAEYGYNAAPWNLHERNEITQREDGFYMRDNSKLLFFHFSTYNFKTPDVISKYYYRYTFDNCPDLKQLYLIYHEKLMTNQIDKLSIIPCIYIKKKEKTPSSKKMSRSKMNKILKLCIPPILLKLKFK